MCCAGKVVRITVCVLEVCSTGSHDGSIEYLNVPCRLALGSGLSTQKNRSHESKRDHHEIKAILIDLGRIGGGVQHGRSTSNFERAVAQNKGTRRHQDLRIAWCAASVNQQSAFGLPRHWFVEASAHFQEMGISSREWMERTGTCNVSHQLRISKWPAAVLQWPCKWSSHCSTRGCGFHS